MKKFVFIALLVALAGCSRDRGAESKPDPVSQPVRNSAATTTAPQAGSTFSANSADPVFSRAAFEEAFTSADPAVRRNCDRALMAYQIGDYSGAVREFSGIADHADLTAEQKQMLDEALEMARQKAAITPDSGATPRPATPANSGDTGTAAPDTTTMDPAMQETIARAEIASRIGDYPKAVAELSDIVNSPDLTAEQRRDVRRMLAEARKNLAADTGNAAKPPVKK